MRSVIKTTVIYFSRRAQRLKTSGLDQSAGKIQNTPKFALLRDSLQRDRRIGDILRMEDKSAVSKSNNICLPTAEHCIIFVRTVSTWVDVNEY